MVQILEDRFNQIFEIALVLLGVFSAAEYDFLKMIYGEQNAFNLITSPIAMIIGIWLAKEIGKEQMSTERWLILTEFTWILWLMTFAYYQFFAWIIEVPTFEFGLIGLITVTVLILGLYYLLTKVYECNYKPVVPIYYSDNSWKLKRFVMTMIGVIIIAFIFGTQAPLSA